MPTASASADLDMALRGEVVYLIGLGLRYGAYEGCGVCHVAVVEVDEAFAVHVAHPLVEVEVLDAAGVE